MILPKSQLLSNVKIKSEYKVEPFSLSFIRCVKVRYARSSQWRLTSGYDAYASYPLYTFSKV